MHTAVVAHPKAVVGLAAARHGGGGDEGAMLNRRVWRCMVRWVGVEWMDRGVNMWICGGSDWIDLCDDENLE